MRSTLLQVHLNSVALLIATKKIVLAMTALMMRLIKKMSWKITWWKRRKNQSVCSGVNKVLVHKTLWSSLYLARINILTIVN